jgi:hypothetical protein
MTYLSARTEVYTKRWFYESVSLLSQTNKKELATLREALARAV